MSNQSLLLTTAPTVDGNSSTSTASSTARDANSTSRVAISTDLIDAVIREVDRKPYLPENRRDWDHEDMPIVLAKGVTVPSRRMTKLMIELLDLQPCDRVLEIGTGSGYQATVLSHLVAEVVTCDVRGIPDRILNLLPGNVFVHEKTDGRFGIASEGVFDAILVTCATPRVEPAWSDQLNEWGRLVLPLGGAGGQWVRKYIKKNGKLDDQGDFAAANFVPICGG